MKKFNSSDSLDALITICPPKDESQHAEENQCYYSKEFEAMLDSIEQEDTKKKRLRSDQVKALERYFEVENKLEPEKKVKLAKELDLQPRQVAIWFQNRRARWKTKQLEKDYTALKANYDSLNLNFENLHQQNQALNQKLKEFKAKVCRETRTESNQSVKEEESPISGFERSNGDLKTKESDVNDTDQGLKLYANFKLEDGSSSNRITGENRILGFNGSSSSSSSSSSNLSMNLFELSNSEATLPAKMYSDQTQFVKMELEQGLFRTEEFCNFFSVDQAPSLHWYNFSDQ